MKQCLQLEFSNIIQFFIVNGFKRDNINKKAKETFGFSDDKKTYLFELYEDEADKDNMFYGGAIYVTLLNKIYIQQKREFIYLVNNPDWYHRHGIEFTGNVIFNEELTKEFIKDIKTYNNTLAIEIEIEVLT